MGEQALAAAKLKMVAHAKRVRVPAGRLDVLEGIINSDTGSFCTLNISLRLVGPAANQN